MHLDQTMATRNTKSKLVPLQGCTALQLYAGLTGVIDFTLWKLTAMFKTERDPAKKLVLATMIEDYRLGKIAVAFSKGAPVYVTVTKNV